MMRKKKVIVFVLILVILLLCCTYQEGEIGTWGRNRSIEWGWSWQNFWPF